MARTLRDFLHVHQGETAWLFGKGPSLDTFDLASAGPLRVAINDVVKEIPGCRYGFANDSVRPWAGVYRSDHVLFTPARTWNDEFLQGAGGPPALACEVVTYPDGYDDTRLQWPHERLATEGLAIRPGTLGSAAQILALMGVTRLICVGIDGGGRHAARTWLTRLRNEHHRDYNRIRDSFIESAPLLGLTIEFHGTAHNPDGTMTLKILSSSIVRNFRDVFTGEVVDVPEAEARVLIAERRARLATAADLEPASPAPAVEPVAAAATEPEAAATTAADSESASLATKRTRRPRM